MLQATTQLYKNAYGGLSKESWYLSIVMLINRSGTMVVPFMSLYCTQQLHYSIKEAGIIMACFGLGSIAGALMGGRITDRFGFYPLQIAALLSGGIFFIIVGYLQSFNWLVIGTLLLSMCNENFRPANSTAIAFYCTPENRTRSYSLNRLAINLGFSIGGALGGFLAAKNYHLLFWVDGLTNITAAFLMLWLLPFKKPEKKARLTAISVSPYKDKVYMLFSLMVICFAFCFLQLFGMQVIFYKTQWHITEQQIGFLMMVNGLLVSFVEMILIHKIEGKKHPLFFIRMGCLLMGLGYLFNNLLPHVYGTALLCVVAITFAEIFALPFMNSFWLARSNDDNRGRYAALNTTAWSIAHVSAPVVASFIAALYGFYNLWLMVAFICVLITFGMWQLQNKNNT